MTFDLFDLLCAFGIGFSAGVLTVGLMLWWGTQKRREFR